MLRDYNGSAELASIDVPTLLTCGEFDEATPDTTRRDLDVMSGIVPGESRRVAAALPNAANGDQPREEGEPQLTILPPSFQALRGGDTGRRGRGMTFVEVPESYLSVVRGFVEAAPETAPAAAVAVAGERRAVGRGLLNGASPCTWSTGGGFYAYPFTAYWNATSGDYGWEARIVAPSQAVVEDGAHDAGRRRRRRRGEETRGREAVTGVGALRFGGAADVYDRPYAEVLDSAVEVGWAAWLVPPEVRPDPQRRGEWTSRAFVGTRVSTASHTFCGCQSMRGDAAAFRLTEHGRASVDIPARPALVRQPHASRDQRADPGDVRRARAADELPGGQRDRLR